MPSCHDQAISNDYYDYIFDRNQLTSAMSNFSCKIEVGYGMSVCFRPKEDGFTYENYYTLPKLFGLADINAAETAGILKIQRPGSLGLTGAGCLIGLIDTGIQYNHEAFLDEMGRSRVVGIWDQTAGADRNPSSVAHSDESKIENSILKTTPDIFGISSENSVKIPSLREPWSVPYGTAYTHAEILAGTAAGPDENGHGTFLASLAAGRSIPASGFTGMAPEAKIAMVKLKPAKRYLRELFLINRDAIAYEESDILLGVRYLSALAEEFDMPLVILLGLESSSGSHTGSLALDDYLSQAAARAGIAVVCAAGNEGDKKHHYYGSFSSGDEFLDVELNVGALASTSSANDTAANESSSAGGTAANESSSAGGTVTNDSSSANGTAINDISSAKNAAAHETSSDTGFTLELWGVPPDIYSLSLISPNGEMVPRVSASITQNGSFKFLLSSTVVEVGFRLLEFLNGDQLIFLRFRNPTPGLWRIRVYGRNLLYGSFHMWLPIEAFLPGDVSFLSPDPDTTVTAPGNSSAILTFSGYDSRTGSFYPASGRGFTAKGQITPELAAPAADVLGARLVPDKNRAMNSETGNTSSSTDASGNPLHETVPQISSEVARFERRSGTSCAAAIGAGACALLLEWGILQNRLPGMRTAEIRNILIRGAGRSRNLSYPNQEFGYGTLNVEDAFLVLADLI